MLSKEFLKEAPGINPATGDPYTPAERDAEYEKNKAQGAKNLQGLKDFGNKLLGRTPAPAAPAAPAPAPAAPASNPEAELDPAIMRARYDQEAAARKAAPADAAPPPPGGEVRPIPSSTIQATPLPASKAFDAPEAGAAPAPMKGGYGSGMNNPSVAPKPAAAAPATDAAAQYAAADASRQPVKAAGGNDELEQMKKNAGLPKTEKAINPETGEEYDKLATDDGPEQLGLSPEQIAAANAPRTEKAINPETGEEYNKLATAQSANDGDAGEELAKIKANAGLAQSANDGDAGEAQAAAGGAPAASSMSQDPAQRAAAAAPAPAPAKAFVEPEPAPAAPAAPESNPEAELDPAIMKARFDQEAAARANPPAATPLPVRPGQQTSGTFGQAFKSARDQGLKTFSYQGKSYSTAMKGAAPAAAKPAAPATTAAKPAAAPVTTAAKPAAPVKPTVKESREINRMRFLAGLSKD